MMMTPISQCAISRSFPQTFGRKGRLKIVGILRRCRSILMIVLC